MPVEPDKHDTLTYRRQRILSTKPAFHWSQEISALSLRDRLKWQEQFRSKFQSLLGGLSGWERPVLNAKVVETLQLDGYRRETVQFRSRPGLTAVGYFLIPDSFRDRPASGPTILCLPGHGRGVGSTVGIAADGTQRPLGGPVEADADFALQCVAQGYPAFALEMIGFGMRRDQAAKDAGAGVSSCHRESVAALMLGETLAGWRVWDAMRALDYLESRCDVVNPQKLAVMGFSGGGLASLFTAALDTRVGACVVSSYFNTFAGSVLAIDHCVDNYIPGLLNLCEMPDLAALIAPRLLFVECGDSDDIFPIASFRTAVTKAEDIYAAWGAQQAFGSSVAHGGHAFYGKAAFEFLRDGIG